jgi:hypothetical protein
VTGECVGNFTISSGTLTIMGMPTAALNGNGSGTVMTIHGGATVTLTNLLITGGVAQAGVVQAGASGGGILNAGTVTLNGNTQIEGNSAPGTEGEGGGIFNLLNSLTVEADAQVDENSAGDLGGGIYNYEGAVTLNDFSQVNENNAGASDGGGGIFNSGGMVNQNDSSEVLHNTPDNTAT